MREEKANEFVLDMLAQQVLEFGQFTLKSGRQSPYFFNLGAINSGDGLRRLGSAYSERLGALAYDFDVVAGPAYKGIPIAVSTSIAMAATGHSVGVAYNRKEQKDHGEGGILVGMPLAERRVVIVDDVLTAGTAVLEFARLVLEAGGRLVAVLVALDRQEYVEEGIQTATESISSELSVPVESIVGLNDVVRCIENHPEYREALKELASYQQAHCRVIE
ncbi:MAG: orotate phosphoribosyltransferase [Pseudomonadota bacterium]|nr:orotate phosphoribosyltransferase [Pseudomonadota bacterium]